MNRRDFFKTAGLGAVSLTIPASLLAAKEQYIGDEKTKDPKSPRHGTSSSSDAISSSCTAAGRLRTMLPTKSTSLHC